MNQSELGDRKALRSIATDGKSENEFDIEWGGFLTNHLSHGQWALDTLGAKYELRETYTRLYKERLCIANEDGNKINSVEELLELQGQRRDFLPQKKFFQEEISHHGAGKTISIHLPSLIHGLAGAALHPIIHIAVGILSKKEDVIAEGLAYLNHSYLAPIDTCNTNVTDHDQENIAAASRHRREQVAANAVDAALAKTPSAPLAMSGRFQRAMGGLLSDAKSVHALRDEAHAQIPLDVSSDNAVVDTKTNNTKYTYIDRLFIHILRIYVGTGSNDYFLLHGLHCAFSLQVIFDEYPSLPTKVKMDGSNALKLALVATEWIQGYQAILHDWKEPWERITDSAKQDLSPPLLMEKASKWIEGRIQSLLDEDASVPRNEHVYKCAAMCNISICRMIEERSNADIFNNELECQKTIDLCAAVDLCMSCDFYGRGIGEKPTKAVDISLEHFLMHQLVLE